MNKTLVENAKKHIRNAAPHTRFRLTMLLLEDLTKEVERMQSERDQAIKDAYKIGWVNCSVWANRDDIIADIESPAYIKDRDDSVELLQKKP